MTAPGSASFDDMAKALATIVASQTALLRDLAQQMVTTAEPPPLDLDAVREQLGVLAQAERVLRALAPDEAEVRRIAERRAEWIKLTELAVASRFTAAVPQPVLSFQPVTHDVEPESEFEAIAQAIREAVRNAKNDLPMLRAIVAEEPRSPGKDELLRVVHRRVALLDLGALYFAHLAPSEVRVRALMPDAPNPSIAKGRTP